MQIGRLLGEGRVAEVFEVDAGVIKLYRAGVGPEQAQREANILDALRQSDLIVPRSLGVVEADGRWGLIMSRMPGRPLGEAMLAGARDVVRILTDMHRHMHGQRVAGLPQLRARLTERIGRAELLTEAERDRLQARLAALPDGDVVCHGDFHPFNIMVDGDRPGIIDWLDATSGPDVADVTRTYLLALHNMPDMAEPYLAARLEGAGFTREDIEAWLPVLAAVRLAENVPEETERLLALARRG